MAREAFLINPPRRRRKSGTKSRRNPWRFTPEGQSEWVDEGGGTRKRRKSKKGGKTMAKRRKKATRKAAPKRRKKRAASAAPRKRRKSTRAVAVPRKRRRKTTKRVARKRTRRSRKVKVSVGRRVAKHGVRSVRINRPRRRKRRNPALMVAGANPRRRRYGRRTRRNPLRVAGFDFFRNMPMIAAGAAAVIATAVMPDYLKLTDKGPLYKYGAQIGTVIGGGFLIKKFLKKPAASYAWMLAGSAVILADLLRQYVIGSWLPSVSGYTAFPSPYTPQIVTDYSAASDYGSMGAFPSPYEGVGAYPSDQYGF